MLNSNFADYGDILDSNDVAKLLNISKRSAQKFIRENENGRLIAGKWLIGKATIEEMFLPEARERKENN